MSFTDQGIVLGLRRRRRLLVCPCGRKQRGRYDTSRRRWRHLDFGACQVWLEADIHRIDCRGCGRVRTEELPWARPGARHSRDFEDVIAWLAQRMDKTSVSRLMRCSWEAVDRIVGRVVVEHVDDARLDDVYRIGVDEISYKRGHISLQGAAVELRINAEDAENDFTPTPGELTRFDLPGGPGVRIDTGFVTGEPHQPVLRFHDRQAHLLGCRSGTGVHAR
ncbi:helix-turn-helix domain-containing protein [Saccharopolyspora pogona]|uniref:helix-turn-helix domain-containing protein n=1 Tax=Saccharopolyspora pogona TaxID=333966 RepID=UPI0021E0A7BF|nr:helix-turn-helix domain-containing protein [Saccharopolyspora pogona]